jgi:hypothetical protein
MIAMQPHDELIDADDLKLHANEIDEVLASLQELLGKVSSPIVRLCLLEAHDDIAHLASRNVISVQVDEHLDVA